MQNPRLMLRDNHTESCAVVAGTFSNKENFGIDYPARIDGSHA
jgi:hypothetical protein